MPNFIGNTTEYPVVTPANVDTVPLVQGGVLKQATTLAIGDVAVAVHEAADDPHPQYAQGASIAGLPSVTAAADDVLLIGRVSTTVTYTATTLSTLALDNSYNDSAGQFVAEGFTVGMDVKVTGFTGNVANNIFSAQITALTANKMTIGGTDGDVIVDDAAGESVTIAAWECVRGTAQDIADLAVVGSVATDAIWDAAGDLVYGTGANTGGRLAIGTARQSLRVNSGATAVEWVSDTQCIAIACSDETTALTTGTAKVTFRMPYAFTLTDVRASVTTAPTGGTLLTVDVNEAGSTILSTKLTFDASEKTTTTAATPRVISDSSLADDAEITVDIDAVGSTIAGAGLKVYLIGYRT
jgi:hypothetical protein